MAGDDHYFEVWVLEEGGQDVRSQFWSELFVVSLKGGLRLFLLGRTDALGIGVVFSSL